MDRARKIIAMFGVSAKSVAVRMAQTRVGQDKLAGILGEINHDLLDVEPEEYEALGVIKDAIDEVLDT